MSESNSLTPEQIRAYLRERTSEDGTEYLCTPEHNRTLDMLSDAADHIAELERELAEAARDAERWRESERTGHPEQSTNKPFRWYNGVDTHGYESAAAAIDALIERREGQPVAPIVKIKVTDGEILRATFYAPGLPDGEHDLFPVPLNPNGQLEPFMRRPDEPRGSFTVWAVRNKTCDVLFATKELAEKFASGYTAAVGLQIQEVDVIGVAQPAPETEGRRNKTLEERLAELPPERRERIEARTAELIAETPKSQPTADDCLIAELHAAAIEVVERWEMPLWKDVPATAVYIARLRNAVQAMLKAAITKPARETGSGNE